MPHSFWNPKADKPFGSASDKCYGVQNQRNGGMLVPETNSVRVEIVYYVNVKIKSKQLQKNELGTTVPSNISSHEVLLYNLRAAINGG